MPERELDKNIYDFVYHKYIETFEESFENIVDG